MSQIIINLILFALLQTIYMVVISTVLSALLGIPLGMLLFATGAEKIWPKPLLNKILGAIVNALRSMPFIILLVAIIPITRWIVGTSIGTNAAMVPLIIAAIPFVARIVENALKEQPSGLIEAALAMGAKPWQIMWLILFPESLPSICNGITVTAIAIVSYSAMAGAVGGGGLGDLAINYGYQRFNLPVMLITVVILVFLVQMIQIMGDFCSRITNKR